MTQIAVDIYERSRAGLFQLKQQLPDDAVSVLAREVIGRLAERGPTDQTSDYESAKAELEALCNALISEDHYAGARMIEQIRADGVSVETVYLGYLAGAARMLGEWWNTDRVSFVDVTIATSRMYAIMRSLRHLFKPAIDSLTKTAIFASVPDETHTLGVRMAADVFRKDGWNIETKLGFTHNELVTDIDKSECNVIGLSAAGQHSIDKLARLVVSLRIVKPAALVLVSGNIADEASDALELMEVDAVATDIPGALDEMNQMWETGSAG